MSGANLEKRSSDDVQQTDAKRACLPIRELSLNTNTSVVKSLSWPVSKAIRELLLNCLDEDPTASVSQTDDGGWSFVNKIHKGRLGLTIKSFQYAANMEKQENRIASGKFGYGMKDAIAILLANGVTFTARSPHGTFTAKVRGGGVDGEIFVAFDDNQKYENGVEQVISCGPKCKLSESELATAVATAKNDCLPFCMRELEHLAFAEVVEPKTLIILGTVYFSLNPNAHATGHTDIFVHNLRYPFVDGGKRLPLYFLYNLNMDKTALRSRDRNELPKAWNTCMSNLLKVSTLLCDKLASQMPLNEQFYEFGHSNILSYVNDAIESRRSAEEEKQQEKKQAEEELNRLQKDVVRLQAKDQDLKVADGEGGFSAHRRRSSVDTEKKLEKAQTLVAAQQQVIDALPKEDIIIKPIVCMWKASGNAPAVSMVDRSTVHLTVATSARSKTFLKYSTDEEHALMTKASIPDSARPIFRELRRLLYALGVQNKVGIVLQTCTTRGVIDTVRFSAGSLQVNFDRPVDELLRTAIVELSSSGIFAALRGMSAAEGVAALGVSILHHTPKDTRLIANNDTANNLALVADSAAPAFCPLLVATEWDCSEGGISTFNMQLARGLAAELKEKNTPVYVLVLSPVTSDRREKVDAEWESALAEGIVVVDASEYRGMLTPMLTPTQCASITHVVGHAHITGAQAKQVSALPQLSHTKLWQINHVMPRTVDIIKENGTQQQREELARAKDTVIQKLNGAADFVWSVGQEMFDHFADNIVSEKHRQLILPLHPDFLAAPTPLKDFNERVKVLYFGRTENVFFVKGMDIAAHACAAAGKILRESKSNKRIVLQIRGTPAGTEAETAERLRMLDAPEFRDAEVSVEGFASPEEVRKDLRSAGLVIMPSRMEPFGLVATEAIACAVPVLVTKNSGVALLLNKHRGEKFGVQTSRYRPDNDAHGYKSDVEAWAQAIVGVIRSGADAFKEAVDLRDRLVSEMKSPYADIVARGMQRL